MKIYLLLIIYILFLTIIFDKNDKKNKTYLGLAFLGLFLVSALRSYKVGIDTSAYVNFYNNMKYYTFHGLLDARNEIGFGVLCKILYMINHNSQFLLVVTSFIINYSVYRFIKKYSNNYAISVFCYVFINYYFIYMNIMRQGLALAVMLFAYDALKKNKNLFFILLVIFASLFHSSALLCLILLPINKTEFNKKQRYLIIPIFILFFLFGNKIFGLLSSVSGDFLGRYDAYAGSKFDVSNYFGTFIAFLFHFFVYFISSFKIEIGENEEEITYMKKLLILGLLICVLGIRVNILNRLYSYFLIYEIIWIPKVLEKAGKNKQILGLILSLVLISYWLIIMVYRPEWYGVVPYSFYF